MRAIPFYRLCVALLPTFVAATAWGDVVDQSYAPLTGQDYSTSYSGWMPIGQSFTPRLSSLNFVNMYIADAGVGPGSNATFDIEISANSMTSPTLATSNVVTVPYGTNTGVDDYANSLATRFTFASPVSLTPGNLYVIDVLQLPPINSTDFNYELGGGPVGGSTYSGGDGIIAGVGQPGFDFAFQEGVPEPSSALCIGVCLAVFSCHRNRHVDPPRRGQGQSADH